MDSSVLVATSAIRDGSMSKAVDDDVRQNNRRRFLETLDIKLNQSILVHLKYEGDDYCRYYEVSTEQAGDGMVFDSSVVADALFTRSKRLALFLPVADCIGAVLYDSRQQILGLAHFGRHNLVQTGGSKVIDYMKTEFASNPAEIQVWLSPAAGREHYPMYDFNNRSLHEVALAQLEQAGVPNEKIVIDTTDTTMQSTLFSHSEFLKGNRKTDGRQAVVAMMRP
jgi:copper oxidase (laccase) domain-containing protein